MPKDGETISYFKNADPDTSLSCEGVPWFDASDSTVGSVVAAPHVCLHGIRNVGEDEQT